MKKRYVKPLDGNCKGAKTNLLKGKRLITLAAVTALAAGALTACKTESGPTETADLNGGVSEVGAGSHVFSAEEAIAEALVSDSGGYADAEYWTEGHIVLYYDLVMDAENRQLKIYALTSVGGYSFMNGKFVKSSGTGAIPMVLVFEGEDHVLKDVIRPQDGSYYESSIKDMFPKDLWDEAMNAQDRYGELLEQEFSHARDYVESIGREAEVCDYAGLEAVLPDMSVEASNRLLELKKDADYDKYPDFVGTREYLEDGGRFIYETAWDGGGNGGTLVYSKYGEDGELVESHTFAVGTKDVFESRSQTLGPDGVTHVKQYDRSEAIQ